MTQREFASRVGITRWVTGDSRRGTRESVPGRLAGSFTRGRQFRGRHPASLPHSPDVDMMKEYGLDLSSYEDVKTRADEICGRLEDGSMPCDGPWPEEDVELFRQWIEEGLVP
jgi:hypothetical protein